MALRIYPLNNTDYNAEDAQIYNCTRTTGVYCAESNFNVTSTLDEINTLSQITVSPGIAWLNYAPFRGVAVANEQSQTLTGIPGASGLATGQQRLDVVALTFDRQANSVSMQIIQGVPSNEPRMPTPRRTSALYEIFLYALKRENVLNRSVREVIDLRLDTRYCGLMRDGVTGLPIGVLVGEAEAKAGTSEIVKGWSALRIRQAIESLAVTHGELEGLVENIISRHIPMVKMFPATTAIDPVTDDFDYDVYSRLEVGTTFGVWDDTEELEHGGMRKIIGLYYKSDQVSRKRFEEYTWDEISSISSQISENALTEQQIYNRFGWRVGDTKDGYRIIGFNHDKDPSNIIHGITLETVDIVFYSRFQEERSPWNVWEGSILANRLLQELTQLPQELRDVIKETYKTTNNSDATGELFVLSEREITDGGSDNEGTVYSYYSDLEYEKRVKSSEWWTRSPSAGINGVVAIGTDGAVVSRNIDTTHGVSFAFCV